jgi:WD40 repeat protein
VVREWSLFRSRRAARDAVASTAPGSGGRWEPGAVVEHVYEVRESLGTDATGVWHLVRHLAWQRDLAVKSPRAARHADTTAALLDEARRWLDVPPHPHLLGCHFVATVAGLPRVFAEHAPGGDLAGAVRAGRCASVDDVLDVAAQLALGLAALHTAGLVHGDVRASSTVFGADGAARLTGFRTGAPERARPADDMRAWAVLVQDLLREAAAASRDGSAANGQERAPDAPAPPAAESAGSSEPAAAQTAGGSAPVVAARGGGRAAPEGLEALLLACAAPEPAARPAGMGAVAARLRHLRGGEPGVPSPRADPSAAAGQGAETGTGPGPDWWNNRAVSFLALGDAERAEAAWDRAMRDDPHHAESMYNLGLRRWRATEVHDDEVVRELAAVHEADVAAGVAGGRVPYLLGLVHRERGDTAAAAASLREAERLSPDDPEIAHALGSAAGAADSTVTVLPTRPETRWIWSVAVTADGGQALWGSEDGSLQWSDVRSGRRPTVLKGHTAQVWDVAVTPDGKYGVSGGADNTVRWWDLRARRCLRTLAGHTDEVRGVDMTPDGCYALSASDGLVRLWDLRAARSLVTLTDEVAVLAVAVTPDGRHALSAGNHGMLRWWDLRSGRCLARLEGHTDAVRSVAVTADGRYALSGSADHDVRWWDLASGTCLRTLTHQGGGVVSVAVTPDGRFGLSGAMDRTAKYWDLATGRCLHTSRFKQLVLGAAMTPAGDRLFVSTTKHESATWSRVAPLTAPWSPSRPSSAAELVSRKKEFDALLDDSRDLLREGRAAEAAGRLRRARAVPGHAHHGELARLWREAGRYGTRGAFIDIRPARRLHVPSGVTSLALAADGRRAVTAGWDTTALCWDLGADGGPRELAGHTDTVTALATTPDGRYAVSGSADATLRWWDLSTGRCLKVLSGHGEGVTSVALTPDGRRVLSGGSDQSLRWWDPESGQCLSVLTGHTGAVASVAVSADGRSAVSGGADSTLRHWDLGSGACLMSLRTHSCTVDAVALSRDGSHAVVGEACGNVEWVDVAQQRAVKGLNAHTAAITGAALPDRADHLLSASLDGALRWWDLESGECVRMLTEHEDEACGPAVTPDASYALSGSRDGALVLWALDWDFTFPG